MPNSPGIAKKTIMDNQNKSTAGWQGRKIYNHIYIHRVLLPAVGEFFPGVGSGRIVGHVADALTPGPAQSAWV